MSSKKLGSVARHHKETIEALTLALFKKNGRLSPDDPEWNCAAKVSQAIAEAYEAKYPATCGPQDTWRKEFVRCFLDRHPELDLEVPRRRRKGGATISDH